MTSNSDLAATRTRDVNRPTPSGAKGSTSTYGWRTRQPKWTKDTLKVYDAEGRLLYSAEDAAKASKPSKPAKGTKAAKARKHKSRHRAQAAATKRYREDLERQRATLRSLVANGTASDHHDLDDDYFERVR